MNWLQRMLAIVGGLLAIGFGLFQLISAFGSPSLPDCDGSDTLDLARQLAMKGVSPFIAGTGDKAKAIQDSIKISNIAEVSFDEDKQVRQCTATIDLTVDKSAIFNAAKVEYQLEWQNRDESRFTLAMKPL